MPTMTIERKEKAKNSRTWAVYSHLPFGNLVAIHFEDMVRRRKVGDRIEEIVVTAKEQVEAFRKTPQVAIYRDGKLTKNEILVFDGQVDPENPRFADVVLNWARKQGVQPFKSEAEKARENQFDRVGALEGRVSSIESKLGEILDAVKGSKK